MAFKKGFVPWNKGKKGIYSEETLKKISETGKGRTPWNKGKKYLQISGEKHPMWGKHHSEEARNKISLASMGRKRTPQALEKFKLAMKGHEVSKKTREKISQANIGKKISNETRIKIGLAGKGRPAWNKGVHMWENKEHPKGALGKPSSKKGKTMSEEFKKKLSAIHTKRLSNPEEMKRQSETSTKTLLNLYETGAFPRQENTKPERQIKEELAKRGYKEGIDFIHQYKFMDKFMCDFCFPDKKVVIEVDGDFWHANPEKYPDQTKLHKHQIKDIGRDKSKNAYIAKVDNSSWKMIRLWESDIDKNVIVCVDRIEEALKRQI